LEIDAKIIKIKTVAFFLRHALKERENWAGEVA
jgi:hypothetical protein